MFLNRYALKEFRLIHGLTHAELGHRAEVTPSHLSQIETGARIPAHPLVARLADCLGVDIKAITHPAPIDRRDEGSKTEVAA